MENQDTDVPWWSPEAITSQEARVRALADQGQLDIRNDFASYRALADGKDPVSAGLHHHNPYRQSHVDALCCDYRNLLVNTTNLEPSNIADLGCGVGFTTAGLKRQWPHAEVTGFDVSRDAVRFARTTWRTCQFEAKAIDPSRELATTRFDFLLCQEFYPFTRTASVDEHRTWIHFLLENLTNNGTALVTVSSANRESINATYDQLKKELKIHRYRIATPRISQRIPFVLSRLLGLVLCKVKPEWARSIYVLSR